jgi:hypothetical protein
MACRRGGVPAWRFDGVAASWREWVRAAAPAPKARFKIA